MVVEGLLETGEDGEGVAITDRTVGGGTSAKSSAALTFLPAHDVRISVVAANTEDAFDGADQTS